MPKVFLTLTTDHYDFPSTTQILSFLDDKLKAAVVFEVSVEELALLRRYYKSISGYGEKTSINVLVENPLFLKELELARAYDAKQKAEESKRNEAEKKRQQKLEEKKKQKAFLKGKSEKQLFEELKKKFEGGQSNA